MLKVRVIPTLLWKDYGLVKGVGFDSWRSVGSVLPAIKVYNARDVDELILVDISATINSHEHDLLSINHFAEECFVPFTVGGGVRSIDQVRDLLYAGADKVSVNSAAYSRPDLISDAATHFGSQCITASVDVRKMPDGCYRCFSHSGTVDTGKNPAEWASELDKLGAGEILLTSIERDGSMEGYDIDLIKSVVDSVGIPVIASGGAGSYEDMRRAIAEGGASAVAAASIYHFTQQTPAETKRYLQSKGIPIRPNYRTG